MFKPSLANDDLDHVLCHAQGVWDELRGQKIFITGGSGFFGTWLVESFLWANERLNLNAQIVVLTRDAATFARRRPHLAECRDVEICTGEINHFDIPPGRFSCIIHAATERYLSDPAFDRLAAYRKDVNGTDRILKMAATSGVRNVLFTSSGAAYGPQPSSITHLTEDYAGAPFTEDIAAGYGHAKRASEVLCTLTAARFGLKIKVARAFTFVGPYLALDANFAVGNFLRDAMAGRPVVIHGDGTPYRSHLYAADLAVWLWTVLFRGRSGRIYNVGSDRAMTIVDLAREVVAAVAPGTEIRVCATPDPNKPPERYVPSIQRATEELGLKQRIDIADALRRTARWHRQRFANYVS